MNTKLTFSTFLLTIFSYCAYSQNVEQFMPKYIYLNAGFNILHTGGGIGGTIILENNWGLTYMFDKNNAVSERLPSNYHPGLLGSEKVYDHLKQNSVRVVKEFDIPSTKLIRFGVEAGLASCKYYEASFFPHANTGGLFDFSSNYDIKYEERKTIGLVIRTKMELLYCKYTGIEVNTTGNFNKYKSSLDLGFYFTFGKVRKSLK